MIQKQKAIKMRADSTVVITITISLSFLLYVYLQSFTFTQAQSLTDVIQINNKSESQIYIPNRERVRTVDQSDNDG